MPVGSALGHRLTHGANILNTRTASKWRQVLVNGCSWQWRSVGPDPADKIQLCAQTHAPRLERFLPLPTRLDVKSEPIHCDGRALAQVICQPFRYAGHVSRARPHCHNARTAEAVLGLLPITAVRPEPGKITGEDERAGRPGKAA